MVLLILVKSAEADSLALRFVLELISDGAPLVHRDWSVS